MTSKLTKLADKFEAKLNKLAQPVPVETLLANARNYMHSAFSLAKEKGGLIQGAAQYIAGSFSKLQQAFITGDKAFMIKPPTLESMSPAADSIEYMKEAVNISVLGPGIQNPPVLAQVNSLLDQATGSVKVAQQHFGSLPKNKAPIEHV